MAIVDFGLDLLCADPSACHFDRRAVGLMSNVASQSRDGHTSLRALREAGIAISALFAPEHGYFGLGSAGESIPDDQLGSLPIYSLYRAGHEPTADIFRTLSAVLIDLQCVGTRWYTFLATATRLMHLCAAANVPVIVLDRPNPQGGVIVEGLIADPAYYSLVAVGAMPVRYGLTFGEAVQWLNQQADPGEQANLTIIPMRGWSRAMLFTDTDRLWSAPSPNIPTAETALIYTGTCLIEGTNLSEGRGTPLPFTQIGAPYITQPEKLADVLNQLALPGIAWRPAWFKPISGKHADQRCGGVRVHITDPAQIRGFALGVHLIATLRHVYPDQFTWTTWGSKNAFDQLAGGDRLRIMLERGQSADEIVALADQESAVFHAETQKLYLYADRAAT